MAIYGTEEKTAGLEVSQRFPAQLRRASLLEKYRTKPV